MTAAALAQLSAVPATSSSSATAIVRTLQGQVVNANDGSPIARVLVTINGRAVLTDSRGHFEFPGFTDAQASVTLTKPGYNQNDDPTQAPSSTRLANLDAAAELKLYPDAVIAGTVTGSDGLPLSGVPVTLRRAGFNATGFVWAGMSSSQTDSHGEYRFREPAGRFQLLVGFVGRSRDTGEIVLPLTFPDASESRAVNVFEASSGQEKHIDLSPRTGSGFTIPVRVDTPDAQRGVQFSASMASGESFVLPVSGQSQQGFQVSLPRGSYTLHARMENRDISLEGSTKLTVTGDRGDPVTLHLEAASSIPVELALDPASTATAPTTTATGTTQLVAAPDVRQFNLRLHNLANNVLLNQDISVHPTENKTYEFRAPPGRYRLDANSNGAWYIESVSYGNSNLMTSDIVLGSGGSGFPIRLIVNNAFGMVAGTVKLPAVTGSTTQTIWVYLIPQGPSLTPAVPLGVSNTGAATGTFSTRLPVGSYLAVAVARRIQADLRDPEVLARLSTAVRPFEVSVSTQATVDLDLAQQPELAR